MSQTIIDKREWSRSEKEKREKNEKVKDLVSVESVELVVWLEFKSVSFV